jgi:phosphohistidine phosphatase
MRLYLVQHGKAVDKKVNPDRPLTSEGAQEVDRVAAFLKGQPLHITEIWHSGKTRARQTAERLASTLVPGAVLRSREGLAPDDAVSDLKRVLEKRRENLMIVGHLPFLSKLAGLLLTGDDDEQVVGFRNGGVVCLEQDEADRWRVAWAIAPELLKASRDR